MQLFHHYHTTMRKHVHKLTKQECDNLAKEMQEIILRVFKDGTDKITRLHTESEQKRLDEIAEILKHCEIVE